MLCFGRQKEFYKSLLQVALGFIGPSDVDLGDAQARR